MMPASPSRKLTPEEQLVEKSRKIKEFWERSQRLNPDPLPYCMTQDQFLDAIRLVDASSSEVKKIGEQYGTRLNGDGLLVVGQPGDDASVVQNDAVRELRLVNFTTHSTTSVKLGDNKSAVLGNMPPHYLRYDKSHQTILLPCPSRMPGEDVGDYQKRWDNLLSVALAEAMGFPIQQKTDGTKESPLWDRLSSVHIQGAGLFSAMDTMVRRFNPPDPDATMSIFHSLTFDCRYERNESGVYGKVFEYLYLTDPTTREMIPIGGVEVVVKFNEQPLSSDPTQDRGFTFVSIGFDDPSVEKLVHGQLKIRDFLLANKINKASKEFHFEQSDQWCLASIKQKQQILWLALLKDESGLLAARVLRDGNFKALLQGLSQEDLQILKAALERQGQQSRVASTPPRARLAETLVQAGDQAARDQIIQSYQYQLMASYLKSNKKRLSRARPQQYKDSAEMQALISDALKAIDVLQKNNLLSAIDFLEKIGFYLDKFKDNQLFPFKLREISAAVHCANMQADLESNRVRAWEVDKDKRWGVLTRSQKQALLLLALQQDVTGELAARVFDGKEPKDALLHALLIDCEQAALIALSTSLAIIKENSVVPTARGPLSKAVKQMGELQGLTASSSVLVWKQACVKMRALLLAYEDRSAGVSIKAPQRETNCIVAQNTLSVLTQAEAAVTEQNIAALTAVLTKYLQNPASRFAGKSAAAEIAKIRTTKSTALPIPIENPGLEKLKRSSPELVAFLDSTGWHYQLTQEECRDVIRRGRFEGAVYPSMHDGRLMLGKTNQDPKTFMKDIRRVSSAYNVETHASARLNAEGKFVQYNAPLYGPSVESYNTLGVVAGPGSNATAELAQFMGLQDLERISRCHDQGLGALTIVDTAIGKFNDNDLNTSTITRFAIDKEDGTGYARYARYSNGELRAEAAGFIYMTEVITHEKILLGGYKGSMLFSANPLPGEDGAFVYAPIEFTDLGFKKLTQGYLRLRDFYVAHQINKNPAAFQFEQNQDWATAPFDEKRQILWLALSRGTTGTLMTRVLSDANLSMLLSGLSAEDRTALGDAFIKIQDEGQRQAAVAALGLVFAIQMPTMDALYCYDIDTMERFPSIVQSDLPSRVDRYKQDPLFQPFISSILRKAVSAQDGENDTDFSRESNLRDVDVLLIVDDLIANRPPYSDFIAKDPRWVFASIEQKRFIVWSALLKCPAGTVADWDQPGSVSFVLLQGLPEEDFQAGLRANASHVTAQLSTLQAARTGDQSAAVATCQRYDFDLITQYVQQQMGREYATLFSAMTEVSQQNPVIVRFLSAPLRECLKVCQASPVDGDDLRAELEIVSSKTNICVVSKLLIEGYAAGKFAEFEQDERWVFASDGDKAKILSVALSMDTTRALANELISNSSLASVRDLLHLFGGEGARDSMQALLIREFTTDNDRLVLDKLRAEIGSRNAIDHSARLVDYDVGLALAKVRQRIAEMPESVGVFYSIRDRIGSIFEQIERENRPSPESEGRSPQKHWPEKALQDLKQIWLILNERNGATKLKLLRSLEQQMQQRRRIIDVTRSAPAIPRAGHRGFDDFSLALVVSTPQAAGAGTPSPAPSTVQGQSLVEQPTTSAKLAEQPAKRPGRLARIFGGIMMVVGAVLAVTIVGLIPGMIVAGIGAIVYTAGEARAMKAEAAASQEERQKTVVASSPSRTPTQVPVEPASSAIVTPAATGPEALSPSRIATPTQDAVLSSEVTPMPTAKTKLQVQFSTGALLEGLSPPPSPRTAVGQSTGVVARQKQTDDMAAIAVAAAVPPQITATVVTTAATVAAAAIAAAQQAAAIAAAQQVATARAQGTHEVSVGGPSSSPRT